MIREPLRGCREPDWLHRAFTWVVCNVAFTVVHILWRPWIQVRRRAVVPRSHTLILCSHPGLFDSFAFVATSWSYPRQVYTMLFRLRELPWSIPDRANYLSLPILKDIIGHMKCVPADRGEADKTFEAMQPLADLVKSGANVCLFPTLGRMRWPVNVDIRAARLVYRLSRECPELTIILGRLSGEPLWCGPRIGRSRWSQVSQFLRSYFQQVFFHRLLIEYEPIDLSDLVSQKPSSGVYREIAKRIAEAITPRDPKFIYKPQATESPA